MFSLEAKLLLGGGLASQPLYDEMFELCGTNNPKIAFDLSPRTNEANFISSKEGWQRVIDKLGISQPIWLQDNFHHPFTQARFESVLEEADVLFIAGGSTVRCYDAWETACVLDSAREAVETGEIVASGVSAGALIWFSEGFSDSLSYEEQSDRWEYIMSKGVGLLSSTASPHYSDTDANGRYRAQEFERYLSTHSMANSSAIGIDTCAAISCSQGQVKVIDTLVPERVCTQDKPGDSKVYLYHQDGSKTIFSPGISFPIALIA